MGLKGCTSSLQGIIIIISLSLITSSLGDFTVKFECPPDWKLIGTHCYNFVTTKLDFYDSYDVCEKYGAILLNVRDEVEAKTISLEAGQIFGQSYYYWISNGYNGTENVINSFPIPNCTGFWQVNEPSNRDTDEKLTVASDISGRWSLKSVWSGLPFVCRAPACPIGSFRCSNGMCLNSRWSCDKAFDCLDRSDENNCSDCKKYYKSSNGSIEYSGIDNCQWVIQGSPGEVIRMSIENLTVNDNVAMVAIYSGGPTVETSSLIYSTDDNTIGHTVFGINQFMIVVIRSYSPFSKITISAKWEPDKELSSLQEQISVSDTKKTISTPYFNSEIVPDRYKKTWILKADKDEGITVEIESSSLDLVNEGSGLIISPVALVLFEPNTKRAVYVSSSSEVTVIAMADRQKNMRMKANVWKGCNFNTTLTLASLELKKGLLRKDCVWTIKNKLATDFSMKLSQLSFNSSLDWLKIYNGTEINSQDLLCTANSSSGDISLFNIYGGVTLHYSSTTVKAKNTFIVKISSGCEKIPDISNMIVSEDTDKQAGEGYNVNVSCELGYAFQQEEYLKSSIITATCHAGGAWNWSSVSFTRFPKCQIVHCGAPMAIKHGRIKEIQNVTYKGQVVYECFEGFVMSGVNTSVCQDNGHWSTPGLCKADDCQVSEIHNGSYNHTTGSNKTVAYGTVVEYYCDSGYDLIGPEKIVCLHNKTWTHEAPYCTKITCNLPSVKYGYYNTTNFTINFGSEVELHCYSGFKISRKNTSSVQLKCEENRALDFNDTCIDDNECDRVNNCTTPNMKCQNHEGYYECVCKNGYNYTGSHCTDINECQNNNGNCGQSCLNQNGSYTCQCGDGFDLYTTNGTDGYYLPPAEDGTHPLHVYYLNHTCVNKTCTSPPYVPLNGSVLATKTRFLINETVQFHCDFGFSLMGSSFAICSSNGNWTYEHSIPPNCTISVCSAPPKSLLEVHREPPDEQFVKPGESLTITCAQQCENCGNITKRLFCAPANSSQKFLLQGDNPNCFAVDCQVFQWNQIPGIIHKAMNDTTFGSSFEFECNTSVGYTLQGQSSLGNATVQCQRNGHWGLNNLTCQFTRCTDPGTKGGTYQNVTSSYEVGQIVRYTCKRPGYKTTTNATLQCEVVNGTAQWSGVAPVCEDAEAPTITCPKMRTFNLYETLIYDPPEVMDNSGSACLILESGPLFGVSVVSKNMTLTFRAIDLADNRATIDCNITLKDQTRPNITCSGPIRYDLEGKLSEWVDVEMSFKSNVSHSQDGNVTFSPSHLNITLGEVYLIIAKIDKDNGHSKACTFLVQPTGKILFQFTCKVISTAAFHSLTHYNYASSICSNDSLPHPENGQVSYCVGTDTNMTCSVTCNYGYTYQDLNSVKNYTCENGVWSSQTPLLPCLKSSSTNCTYNISVKYHQGGVPGQSASYCEESYKALLHDYTKNLTICGLSDFSLTSVESFLDGPSTAVSAFLLHVVTNGANESSLQQCSTEIKNSTYYSPFIFPKNDCKSPWTKYNDSVDFLGLSCPSGSQMINTKYCLICGPGYYLNNTNSVCTHCEDGTYQNKSGQTECLKCASNHSVFPRTSEKHCLAYCPDGFVSSSGFLTENCEQCPVNTYSSKDHKACLNCSNGTEHTQCLAVCKQGFYSSTGFVPCKPCPLNYYSDLESSTECQECPNNAYTLSEGSADNSSCQLNSYNLCKDFCHPKGIISNTICKIENHRPVCQCRKGYHGNSCNQTCDFCSSKPCENEGRCIKTDDSNLTCECKTEKRYSFFPVDLDFTVNPAYAYNIPNINPELCADRCLINDTCLAYMWIDMYCLNYHEIFESPLVEPSPAFKKNFSMLSLFDGDRCEIDLVNDCVNSNVCSSEDFCMDLVNSTKCVCPLQGFSDEHCNKKDNLCNKTKPCVHGDCVEFESVRYTCVCEPGYTGENCNLNIDECALNPFGCLYNGICQDSDNDYNCSCKDGFSGKHCEIKPDLCANNDCKENVGGICIQDYEQWNHQCYCGEYFSQINSSQCMEINFCETSPCKNNGSCSSSLGHQCTCPTGFIGSLCQIEVEKEQNETTCDSLDHCVDNNFCEVCGSQTGNCTLSCLDKCRNFSKLTSHERKLCSCFCHEKTTDDDCLRLEPCLHGGTCADTDDGYNCTCTAGWSGQNCTTPRDYCHDNTTCANESQCVSLYSGTFCQCQNGTNGVTCNETTNLCEDFKGDVCGQGNCSTSGGTAVCQCPSYLTGKSCEIKKDACSNSPCNGGKCLLNGTDFHCDCEAAGKATKDKYCNATTEDICVTCSNSCCITYVDNNGILKSACLCQPDEIFTGGACTKVNKDFDLVFLKAFESKKTWVTSLQGFSLDKVLELTVTLWVAAAKPLSDYDFVLSLASSEDVSILSISNSEVQFSNVTIIRGNRKLDESNSWHFIAVIWAANGTKTVYFDNIPVHTVDSNNKLPKFKYNFVKLGQGFHGYITYVQIWNASLGSAEIGTLYDNKSSQPDNLLFDWNYYSFDDNVLSSNVSLAKRDTSICDGLVSSPLYPLPSICHISPDDRESPKLEQECLASKHLPIDYTLHQVSTSQLGYSFVDNRTLQTTKPQFLSHGAHDVAVAANDSFGNVGVCMTRTYITPNECQQTKPAGFRTCDDHGAYVQCATGQFPSTPMPRILTCGQLRSYNLDNMYENIDKIVCGDTSEGLATFSLSFQYKINVSCDEAKKNDVVLAVKSTTHNLPGLCESTGCNFFVEGSCAESSVVNITISVNNIRKMFNSTISTEDYWKKIVQDSTISNLKWDAQLQNETFVSDDTFSCLEGNTVVEHFCVECGKGSYYNNASKKCELCPLNFYSEAAKQKECSPCPNNTVTLQRGSSSSTDCVENCAVGKMFNKTSGQCMPCPVNFYQNQTGKHYCFPCPPSHGTLGPGSDNLARCAEYCPPGTQLNSSDLCEPCPTGSYRVGDMQDQCKSCEANFTTIGIGHKEESDCILPICPPGMFANIMNGSVYVCTFCEIGFYQPDSASLTCLPCNANFTTIAEGSVSSTQCLLFCQPGFGNNGSCFECKQGYWNNGNLSMRFQPCERCPVNYTTVSSGATDVQNCSLRDCPAGTIIVNDTCQPCEVGYYQPQPHQLCCHRCRNNTSTSSTGSTRPDECTIKCDAGYEGSLNDTCLPCGDDEFKSAEGFGLCQSCTGHFTSTPNNRTHCTEVYCDFGYENTSNNCSPCFVGFYKPHRGNDTCTKCPGNTTTAGIASISEASCDMTFCEPGLYSADNVTCVVCPLGYYKNISGNKLCTECPANLTTAGVGSTSLANCSLVLCHQGTYRVNSTYCGPCPVGTYQNETNQPECFKCPLVNGYNSSTFNNSSISLSNCYPECPAGKFLNLADIECWPCPYATYKNSTSLSLVCSDCEKDLTTPTDGSINQVDCRYNKCGKGYYRLNFDNVTCMKCPIGQYKNITTSNVSPCYQCPDNKTTLMDGVHLEKLCISNCPGGQQYSLVHNNCTLCLKGQYKESFSDSNVCKLCPPYFTTDEVGSVNCILANGPTQIDGPISISIVALIHHYSCEENVISDTIFQVIRMAQQDRYPGLCPTIECSNVAVTFLETCKATRKRETAKYSVKVKMDFKNMSLFLSTTSGNRSAVDVITELFGYLWQNYDQLVDNGIEIVVDTYQVRCHENFFYNAVNPSCVRCPSGKYVNDSTTCVDCPVGQYSTSPPSMTCLPCPEKQTTNVTGSQSISDCKGHCFFTPSYCGIDGKCELNPSSDVHECRCNGHYVGDQCTQRLSAANTDIRDVVIGVSCGVGALLLIILIVVGCQFRKRRRRKAPQSLSSDSEVFTESTPNFHQPLVFHNPAMLSDPTIYTA